MAPYKDIMKKANFTQAKIGALAVGEQPAGLHEDLKEEELIQEIFKTFGPGVNNVVFRDPSGTVPDKVYERPLAQEQLDELSFDDE